MWRRGEGKEGSKAEVDGQCKCGIQGEESVGGGGGGATPGCVVATCQKH